jgi:hypothetical protein
VLRLSVSYAGPAGTYSLDAQIPIHVGRDVDVDLFTDDFEGGDNGWTHAAVRNMDDWEHDVVVQDSATDPPSAFSGTLVWGNDLGGGSNGNYARNSECYLESPSFDCSLVSRVLIAYRRWLSVEDGDFDHARVIVNGVRVWENPAGADFIDTAWTYVEHDISAIAAGNPAVQVRFSMDSDAGLQYGGWTLDDFRLFTRVSVCEGARGCETLPTPAAIPDALRATGVKDQDGLELDWRTATRQPGEHFRLYRGTTPTSLSTLVTPADYTGTSFDDRAAPDALYFYSLHLADCDGVEGP